MLKFTPEKWSLPFAFFASALLPSQKNAKRKRILFFNSGENINFSFAQLYRKFASAVLLYSAILKLRKINFTITTN